MFGLGDLLALPFRIVKIPVEIAEDIVDADPVISDPIEAIADDIADMFNF